MHIQHARRLWQGFFPLVGIIVMLFLSACGGTANAATSSENSPGVPTISQAASSVQGLSLLLKSAQAMRAITSVHMDVSSHGTFASSGGTLPSPAPRPVAYTLALHTDVAIRAQQEQGKLQLTLNRQKKTTLTLSEVLSGQKLYYKVNTPTAQGKQVSRWMIIDLAPLISQVPTDGKQLQDLLPLVMQQVMVTDKGTTQAQGVQVHHITMMLSQQSLGQIATIAVQPMFKQVLSSIRLQTPLQVDLFIEDGTSFLRQVAVKGQVQVNVDKLIGKGPMKQGDTLIPPHMLEVNMKTSIGFSNYNQPVQIHVPTVAAQSQQ